MSKKLWIVYTKCITIGSRVEINFSVVKSKQLKKQRGVSFEEILQTKLIAVKENPARINQKILLFEFKDYIWVVPYVTRQDKIFLKTLFPSRKYTKIWQGGKLHD